MSNNNCKSFFNTLDSNSFYIEQKPYVDDKAIWAPDRHFILEGSPSHYHPIISKEMFCEAYDKWVAPREANRVESKQNEAKIAVCPFCGQAVARVVTFSELTYNEIDDDNSYCVCCSYPDGGCGACGGFRGSAEEAIKVWNQRANDFGKGN